MEQMTIDPITIQITPSLNLLKDIVITACEGGIGYWSILKKYKWAETGSEPRVELPFPVAVILEVDEDNEPGADAKELTITPEVVRKGLQLALTPGVVHPESNTYKSVFAALTEDDAGEIDSDAADNVIQLGLFGKIVYG